MFGAKQDSQAVQCNSATSPVASGHRGLDLLTMGSASNDWIQPSESVDSVPIVLATPSFRSWYLTYTLTCVISLALALRILGQHMNPALILGRGIASENLFKTVCGSMSSMLPELAGSLIVSGTASGDLSTSAARLRPPPQLPEGVTRTNAYRQVSPHTHSKTTCTNPEASAAPNPKPRGFDPRPGNEVRCCGRMWAFVEP